MARPFVKFPGGKRGIIEELTSRLPEKFDNYFEPFVGGGALFFELKPKNAYISDINSELILCYKVIQKTPKKLIRLLSEMPYVKAERDNSQYFYKLRDLDRSERYCKLKNYQKVARVIYLNKTCFNGLFRYNSKGQFNSPFGYYKNPKICDEKNILNCAKTLRNTTIENKSFEHILEIIKPGDFVYFDPPYVPFSATANFTSYNAEGFNFKDQKYLAMFCRELNTRGIQFMLSNSNTEIAKKLYKGFRIEEIAAPRAINRDASGRRGSDIIVRNY